MMSPIIFKLIMIAVFFMALFTTVSIIDRTLENIQKYGKIQMWQNVDTIPFLLGTITCLLWAVFYGLNIFS